MCITVIIPRGMPTRTFNIHDLHVCKQPQALKTTYNLVVLPFLTRRLGTLAHNTTLMSKQVCKQQRTVSGIKHLTCLC